MKVEMWEWTTINGISRSKFAVEALMDDTFRYAKSRSLAEQLVKIFLQIQLIGGNNYVFDMLKYVINYVDIN